MCASLEDTRLRYVLWMTVVDWLLVPITTVAKATCAHVAEAEMCMPVPIWSEKF